MSLNIFLQLLQKRPCDFKVFSTNKKNIYKFVLKGILLQPISQKLYLLYFLYYLNLYVVLSLILRLLEIYLINGKNYDSMSVIRWNMRGAGYVEYY